MESQFVGNLELFWIKKLPGFWILLVVFCVVISWVNDQRIWKSPTILKWLLINMILDFVRCSRTEVFCIKCAVNNFVKLMEKHLCQSLFFNKFTGLEPATLLKKTLWHRCFPMNFGKVLRRSFLQNTSERLLLLCFISVVLAMTLQ